MHNVRNSHLGFDFSNSRNRASCTQGWRWETKSPISLLATVLVVIHCDAGIVTIDWPLLIDLLVTSPAHTSFSTCSTYAARQDASRSTCISHRYTCMKIKLTLSRLFFEGKLVRRKVQPSGELSLCHRAVQNFRQPSLALTPSSSVKERCFRHTEPESVVMQPSGSGSC